MTLLFIEGFENLAADNTAAITALQNAGWSVPAGLTTANQFRTAPGRFGGSCLELAPVTGAAATVTFQFGTPTIASGVLGVACRWPSASAFGAITMIGRNFSIGATGAAEIRNSANNALIQAGPARWVNTQWNFLEIVWRPTGVELWVNGSLEATDATATVGSDGIFTLRTTSNGLGMSIDDLYVLNTLGTVNNARLGDCRVETRLPTADVSLPGTWTLVGAATAADALDDPTGPDGDATTVNGTTVGAEFVVTSAAPLSSNPAAIFGVQANVVARRESTGTRTIRVVNRNAGGFSIDSADQPLSATYTYRRAIFETDAAGAAWTRATAEGMRVGVRNQA